jgi:hypothetical protein
MGIIYYSNGPYANVLLMWAGLQRLRNKSSVYILEYSTMSFGEIGGTHGMLIALSMAIFTVCGSTLRFWKNEAVWAEMTYFIKEPRYIYPGSTVAKLNHELYICKPPPLTNFNALDRNWCWPCGYIWKKKNATVWGYVGQLDFADETNLWNLLQLNKINMLHAVLLSVQ